MIEFSRRDTETRREKRRALNLNTQPIFVAMKWRGNCSLAFQPGERSAEKCCAAQGRGIWQPVCSALTGRNGICGEGPHTELWGFNYFAAAW